MQTFSKLTLNSKITQRQINLLGEELARTRGNVQHRIQMSIFQYAIRCRLHIGRFNFITTARIIASDDLHDLYFIIYRTLLGRVNILNQSF